MISSTIHRFLQHLYKHTRVFQSLKSLHILFHHLPPFWDHFMRAVNPWIIPCVEAICHSAPRGPLKAESAERDYKSRGLPRTYRMPWRYSEEPKPSGNKSCSSSVRLWSFSWDERKGYDMQGLEAPASHLWIHGGDANRARPDVETTDWPEEVKEWSWNLILERKLQSGQQGSLRCKGHRISLLSVLINKVPLMKGPL